MSYALNWLALVAATAVMLVVAGFVLKGYWLLFMLGWGAL